MNVDKLLSGVAVVIDDEIDDKNASIQQIIDQIEDKKMPIVFYKEIPPSEAIPHLESASFIVLDWKRGAGEAGVNIGSQLEDNYVKENINFLEEIIAKCFCPIFIFSNESITDIEAQLKKAKIDVKKQHSFILLKSKSCLRDKLFDVLKDWISETPSIYVLKEWQREYHKSINQLFLDFQKLSPNWPLVFWENSLDDNTNPSRDLGELITRNLHTRMAPFEFEEEPLNCSVSNILPEQIRNVMEGERYLKNPRDDDIAPGDVFKKSKKYYVNIRAACDLIPRGEVGIDDIKLYLIQGKKLSPKEMEEIYSDKYSNFQESDTFAIIYPIEDGKALRFNFKDLSIKSWEEMKGSRKGRILAPHVVRLQQRFALYQQRQGLPRIPSKLAESWKTKNNPTSP